LVIDEIGPLELLDGRGWVTALDVLRSRAYGGALVVCRPGLLEELCKELVTVPTTLLEVTPQVRDGLPAVLVAELRAAIARSW
jgi:hypothetical protein